MNTLIVTGGEINLTFLKDYYIHQKPQLIIAVDKGLDALHKVNITPHHIVGDFDSVDLTKLQNDKTNPQITVLMLL